MTKWIIGALLLAATVVLADRFDENEWKGDMHLRADGVMDYNPLVISTVVNSTTLARVSGCPKTIIKKMAVGNTVDTLVFSNCPQGSTFWLGAGMDSLDGASSLADVITVEVNGDSLFVKRQAATGALRGYVLMRLY